MVHFNAHNVCPNYTLNLGPIGPVIRHISSLTLAHSHHRMTENVTYIITWNNVISKCFQTNHVWDILDLFNFSYSNNRYCTHRHRIESYIIS